MANLPAAIAASRDDAIETIDDILSDLARLKAMLRLIQAQSHNGGLPPEVPMADYLDATTAVMIAHVRDMRLRVEDRRAMLARYLVDPSEPCPTCKLVRARAAPPPDPAPQV